MNNQLLFYQQKLNFEIDSWDLYTALNNGENIVVIDVRKNTAYNTEHIQGAVNLHHSLINTESTSLFDRNALYVTYCDGIGCNGSTKGALKMLQLGFKVREMIGGLDWWKRDGYQTEGEKSTAGLKIQCGC